MTMPEKPKAAKLTIDIPIKIERIANGERFIVQTGPDEYGVDIVD